MRLAFTENSLAPDVYTKEHLSQGNVQTVQKKSGKDSLKKQTSDSEAPSE